MPAHARLDRAARAAAAVCLLAQGCGDPRSAHLPAPAPEVAPPVASIAPAPLPPLPPLHDPPRGLGSMTARAPGTTETVGGVRLASHHATVTVVDGIAHTEVEEEFRNDTDRVLEGRLRLPVPSGAALSRLALWVGDQLVEGEVVARDRAARIFRGIVDDTVRPRDPALLEVVSGGELSLKIFPLPARGSRKVVFAYDEVLRAKEGEARYVHPLSLGAARATSIDSLRVTVNGRVALDQRDATPTEDLVVPLDGVLPALVVAAEPGGGQTWLARSTAEAAPGAASSAGDVVVAIDTSDRQSAASLAAQAHLAAAVLDGLAHGESFALLACDTACASYPERGLAAPTEDSRIAARTFLTSLAPSGASDPAGAVLAAMARLDPGRRGQVLWMSDGTATAGELSVDAALAHVGRAGEGVDVRVFGAGRAIDHASLSALAAGLGATYDPVADGAPILGRVRALAASRRRPKVAPQRAEGAPDAARRPWARAGDEVITLGRGEVAGARPTSAPITRLWAQRRVSELEAQGDADDRELVKLSVKHHLLSKATALLVLESDGMFAEFGVARTRPAAASAAVTRSPDAALAAPGRLTGAHVPRAPSLRMGATQVSGRIATEVIQRVVRQRFGSFRACYEAALRRRPTLAGRAVTRFVIARDGSVTSASDGGSDLDDPAMLACVRAAFLGMSFPAPEHGVITVVYPLVFVPADASEEARPESRQRDAAPPAPRAHTGLTERLPWNSALNPPDVEPPAPELPTASLRAGDERWRDGDAARLASLADAVARDPARRRAHLDLVRASLARGRFEGAREAAAKLVALDPDLPEAQEALAEALAALGRGAEAARASAMAAALEPRSVTRQLVATRAALAEGDDTRACAHLRALGDLKPGRCAEAAAACRRGERARLSPDATEGLRVGWRCEECSGVAIVSPAGRVSSPWTSTSVGEGEITVPLTSGTYRVVALDARPLSVEVRALGALLRASHAGGAATLAHVDVRIPWPRARPRVAW